MTTKTRQTLATIDRLAGKPDSRVSHPTLVVPQEAYSFYDLRQLARDRDRWRAGRGKYDSGLLFRLK